MILLLRTAFLVLLVGLWYLAAANVGRNVIATPLETLDAARRLAESGRLLSAVGDTLRVYLTGFALAALVAIPAGVLMGTVRILGKTLDIFVFALAATPRVAFIPLIIVLLGLGLEAKVFIVFLGAIMPILINTYAGVQAVDDELIEMARSVAASRARIFWRIILPSAVPFTVAGLRIGATIGLINTVVAELYTAVSGLGGLLALFGNTFRMAEYLVIVITLALIGVVVTEILRQAERRLEGWRGKG
ncbi:ABC transporter permease subunit [Halovulum dunhuangense]|uniref:ABC transporter permease subunit n=1 Tax=Halovulum dunhuangense TaxID=1505036 RepID=A0A849L0Z6_9RHOB|nr:ABC transporter permease subunit [Halovulum dunhuangense]NNU79934.1 ABC transporter permease subunit [Halovulum dunhuangense]